MMSRIRLFHSESSTKHSGFTETVIIIVPLVELLDPSSGTSETESLSYSQSAPNDNPSKRCYSMSLEGQSADSKSEPTEGDRS